MSKENVESFINCLYDLIKEYHISNPKDYKFSEDLLIILKAHAKAIKLYNLKKYSTFHEIVKITKRAAELVTN
jgi:protein associated with RNAse G/E